MRRCCALLLAPLLLLLPLVAKAEPEQPDPYTVQHWGKGYRFAQEGWISVHIEGAPLERGLQHGHLLAPEIAAYIQAMALFTDPKHPRKAWEKTRQLAQRDFIRGFDNEQLTEIAGIAKGARDAGARFYGRPLDLLDLVALNLVNELDSYQSALEVTPPKVRQHQRITPAYVVASQQPAQAARIAMRCNAFAATGPATRDGGIVFGHMTMFSLYPANFYNIWLDVKPARGHRFVMQTSPGSIESGMDYSINDAGILMSETTLVQTSYNPEGRPLAARIRQAEQYADTIEEAAKILSENGNGLSTTEWILADAKRNQIALLTVGTHHSKLYRSSQQEWIGGAEGFYWSNNNAKDLPIRLESIASPTDRPSAAAAMRTTSRDALWLRMYDKYKGQIDGNFAKTLLTTPEIALSVSVDAKYTTSALASRLQTEATFGPPLGAIRAPDSDDERDFPDAKPLVSHPWVTLGTLVPASLAPSNAASANSASVNSVQTRPVDLADPDATTLPVPGTDQDEPDTQPAWRGTLLPQHDSDIWLTTAFANYEEIVALAQTLAAKHGGQLTQADQDLLDTKLFYYRSRYELAARASHDTPLSRIQFEYRDEYGYDLAAGKGVLLLDALRHKLGDKRFDRLMGEFGKRYTMQPVSAAQFQQFLARRSGQSLDDFFTQWLTQSGLPADEQSNTLRSITPHTIFSFDGELEQSLIVYGTQNERVANLEAARELQQALIRRKHNYGPPIKADTEVTEAERKSHHLVLIGRPDTNTLVAAMQAALPVHFTAHSFAWRGKRYANPQSGVLIAMANPDNPRYSSVVVAGLDPLGTILVTQPYADGALPNAPLVLLPAQQPTQAAVPIPADQSL